jgi:ABC-2 type transport system ATP-binding protein
VLVVDEPMVGLDPKSVRIVKDLLKKAAREGTAIFMSTHTLAIAEEMAHRIGIFHQGRLIRCGTIDELRRETTSDTTLEDFFLQVTADAEQAEVVR